MDYWRLGAGARVRTLNLARYLGGKTELTIAHLGPERPGDERLEQACRGPWRFVWLERSHKLEELGYARHLRALCEREPFDACIIDRLRLGHIPIKGIPTRVNL